MAKSTDWNRAIIEEFRIHGGMVGGMFEDTPLVLLTTTGAKSGKTRTTPLVYLPDGDRIIVFASKGGSPTHPSWYHNLQANPQATVEVGTDQFDVTAVELQGEERDGLYSKHAEQHPQFAEYQATTSRTIPVIALERDA
ncbi:MAG: nitroreductase family deazaflavin-dependent oxidoreductase [Actinobacteria bacterium]|nr:nitroreductase family deazaflavin-dependent oxidoreductase [Actinomycetota bacterium]